MNDPSLPQSHAKRRYQFALADLAVPGSSMAAQRALRFAEAGRRGGVRVREKYGSDFYREIGRKGGLSTIKKHGVEHFERIGVKGGETVKLKGIEFYKGVGRKGGAAMKRKAATKREAVERAQRDRLAVATTPERLIRVYDLPDDVELRSTLYRALGTA